MSEISDLLQREAGLSPDKAQEVEQIIVQHITAKVPAEFQGLLGPILGSGAGTADNQTQTTEAGGLGSLLSSATSLFNRS